MSFLKNVAENFCVYPEEKFPSKQINL